MDPQQHPHTGPVSDDGKARSSANATTHGLTARRPLHEEEAERLRIIAASWRVKSYPQTPLEEALVDSAAIEYVRYLRCVEAEEARLKPAISENLRLWREKRQHAIRRRAQDLPDDPAGIVAELHETAFGIDWMLRHWKGMLARLDSGKPLVLDDLKTAMHLVGHAAHKPISTEGDPSFVWETTFRAFPQIFLPGANPAPQGLPEAAASLRTFIAGKVDRLESLRPLVWEDIDAPEAHAVEAAALIDTSKEGQLRHRYRRDAFRDFHKSMAQLTRMRTERSKMHAREAKIPTSPGRADLPAYVPPTRSPAPPDSRNEPPRGADPGGDDRHNPMAHKEPRNAAPDHEAAPDRRTLGRTEGRTDADRTAPQPTCDGRSQAEQARRGPLDGPDAR